MKYVLTGSLGNITQPMARTLIAAGHDVTIISSSKDRSAAITALGAKPAIGNITDTAFLTSTFKGADAVYTMVPPIYQTTSWKEDIYNHGKSIAAAIKASGVKKVVNLSSIGAHMPEGCGPVSGIHRVEEELNKLSGVDIIHLRPGYFYTNLLHAIGMIKHAGFYGNNFGADAPIVLVHPRDIAAAAAEELQSLAFTGKSIRYIADDVRTSKEIAAVLGAAIGKADLPYVEFTDEQAFTGAVQAGLSEELSRNYMEMGAAFRSGEMISDYKKHKVTLGNIKLEDFAKEFAAAYAKA